MPVTVAICGSALTVALLVALPVGILAAFATMRWQCTNTNILSLREITIAIDAIMDAAIVMVENLHKHLE